MEEQDNKELAPLITDPKDAEVILNEFLRFSLRMTGKTIKSIANHETYLTEYAKLIKRLYDEFLGVGFTDEQAFKLTQEVIKYLPPFMRW